MSTRILITGGSGQVAQGLIAAAPVHLDVLSVTRRDLDLTDLNRVLLFVKRQAPDWIINTAAYTSVDKAEEEPIIARSINVDGVGNLAFAASQAGARLLHLSTDFVFDGKATIPYVTTHPPSPLNIYGQTKYEGELAAINCTRGDALIVRTAWLYDHLGKNFFNTMRHLLANRDIVSVVGDQKGTPTRVSDLAAALWAIIAHSPVGGIYHFTNHGQASWYDFAESIYRLMREDMPSAKLATLNSVLTHEFPTKAKRPRYSVLDTTAIEELIGQVRSWEAALCDAFAASKRSNV